MSKTKEMEIIQNPEAILARVDDKKVTELKAKLEAYKKSLTEKEYALAINEEQLLAIRDFMNEEVSWKGQEAFGIVKIAKALTDANTEGINNGVVYFSNLVIEATHYFLNRWEGKGVKQASIVNDLINTFSETLTMVHQDNLLIKDFEKEIAAAEQGIEAE
jgi:hypothetical protein